MAHQVLALLALFACGAAGNGVDVAKNRPVTKVVTLLKDMLAQLDKESREDTEVYETMGCWCETNDKGKTKAIADAKSKIQQLGAASESNTALASQLDGEIAQLNDEIAKNTEALETATTLRQKQLAEFTEEEKDMLQSIGSMGSAIKALSKHHSSFLQVTSSWGAQSSEGMEMLGESSAELGMIASVRMLLRKHLQELGERITPKQRRAALAFVQQGSGSGAGYNPEYKPQSGAIFGVIEAMKEEFEKNLASSQSEETNNQQAYEAMKMAKESEIKAGNEQVELKTNQMAEAGEKAAQESQEKAQTQTTMEADIKFLANLKEQCANVDAEFAERTKTRQLEMQAVSKALEFLTSEEAQDLVSRTLGLAQRTSFAQRRMENQKVANRVEFSRTLNEVARSAHDPRISAIAVRVRLDAFEKVKESLQGMIDKLLQEKEDEIKQKDYCIDSINTNLRNTENEDRNKQDAQAKAEAHEEAVAKLTKEIQALKDEVAEMQVQIKKATEEREKANSEYQVTVADQRATQKLLTAALGVLKGFYEKAALMQARAGQPAGPPPPPSFKKYENNAASGGVMNMIQSIIDDAKAMESDAIKAEEESMTTYETFITDSNASIEDKQKEIVTKTEIKAREEQDKVMEEGNRDAAQTAWDQLRSENLDLHASCDYLIKNFDVRLERRDEEVEALKQGLATFTGATFSSFIQHPW